MTDKEYAIMNLATIKDSIRTYASYARGDFEERICMAEYTIDVLIDEIREFGAD